MQCTCNVHVPIHIGTNTYHETRRRVSVEDEPSSSSSLKRRALAEKKDEHEEMATFAEIASEIVFEKCNGFGYD